MTATAYVEQLLVLGNIPDEQAAELGIAYDPNDERHIRHVIRCVIAPYFARWDTTSQNEARTTLAEVIVSEEDEWLIDAWEADLPPVDLPDEPLRFVTILWDELFGGQDPAEHVDHEAEVDADPTVCNRMRVTAADGPEIAPDLLELLSARGAPRGDT
jgi:hypothetical protein